MSRITVQHGQRAVVRRDGAVLAVLGVGRHPLPRPYWRRRVDIVDVRERLLILSGHEVSAADLPGLKISATASWLVSDPVRWLDDAAEPVEVLRLAVALAVRDWVAARTLEQVVAERGTADAVLAPQVRLEVQRLGIDVARVSIRDVVVPAEVRRALLAVGTARQEGLAALERARGETAALRAMANGARILEEHPQLARLRLVQTAALGGGGVVLKLGSD